ncbi:MAG TPA: HNH endonuclease [Opitutaceae bacterium]|nr:HNH endonuclease [Opitutaceae bacterium]
MPREWSRDELVVAMNVYGRLTFGQLHARNPLVIDVAAKLDRTPGSLAMKLCNLASLDPAITSTGRKGLSGASELDRQVWAEFEANWDALGVESEQRFNELMYRAPLPPEEQPVETDEWTRRGNTDVQRTVRQRQGQDFFRRTVLISYGNRCCITGMPVPALLSASHIVAWKDDVPNRLNPRNGLCLAKPQDAAFDRHLITLDEDLRVVLSKSLRDHFASDAVRTSFAPFEGKSITLPYRFRPDPALLARHRAAFAG